MSIDDKIHRGGECGGHVVDGDDDVVVVGGLRVEDDDVRSDLIEVYNVV